MAFMSKSIKTFSSSIKREQLFFFESGTLSFFSRDEDADNFPGLLCLSLLAVYFLVSLRVEAMLFSEEETGPGTSAVAVVAVDDEVEDERFLILFER